MMPVHMSRHWPAALTKAGRRPRLNAITSNKEGANSTHDRELPDAEVVISQPFWPATRSPSRHVRQPRARHGTARPIRPCPFCCTPATMV
jgi:hypothetical protein